MTTLENVTAELKRLNFPTTGSYSKLPESTYNLVLNILHFGNKAIEESTLGKGIKALAIELAKKDGRNLIVCKETLKTVLI